MSEISLATERQRAYEAPLITVITPCLNSIKSISDNLQSVIEARKELNAKGWDLEHIILEGGSYDGTAELVTAHTEKHQFCKLLSDIKGGPYPAMNVGLKHATGIYAHILNADDFIMQPISYADLILRGHNLCTKVLICSIAYFKRPKTSITRLWLIKETLEDICHWQGNLRKGLHYPHPGFIAKTETYRDESFDETYTLSADYKLMQNILMKLNSTSEVLADNTPLVAMAEGGSTGSWSGRLNGIKQIASINKELGIDTNTYSRFLSKVSQLLQAWRRQESIIRQHEENNAES